MRIIGGEFRGRRLRAPRGHGTRPTPDRVREAVFLILADAVPGARVAELFGGTGSLGLEALSRGAAFAVFTETDPAALACLSANIEALGVRDRTLVLRRSAFELPRTFRERPPFDLAFCDPPHRMIEDAAARRRVEGLLAALPLHAGGLALLEHRAGALRDFAPPGRELVDLRTWGSTGMAFYGPAPSADSP